MNRRVRVALFTAAVLLALAAVLMRASEEPSGKPTTRHVDLPRWMRQAEFERLHRRRTLPPKPADLLPPNADPPRPRDPFLVALPPDPGKGLVVFEANALRNSRLGELFVDCVVRASARNPFEEMRRETGIDPLKDIDRVAVGEEGILVSGFFDRARFDRLEAEAKVTPYGRRGRIFGLSGRSRAEGPDVLGAWGDNLLFFGPRAFVESAIDRLEGRASDGPPIPEELTYGEAYGVIPGRSLLPLFTASHSQLGARLAAVASHIDLHVDAMQDVALVAHVTGPDREQLDDLGKSLGTALAVLRLDAKVRGNAEVAELLEYARVEHLRQGFNLELALPIGVMEGWFNNCGTRSTGPGGR